MARRKKVPPALHDLEAEVMDEVWRQGEASVRSVMEACNRGRRSPRAYTTYLTIMVRLDGKGLLGRRREGKTDHYHAVLTKEQYQAARAEAEVAALVGQYGDVALSHFARQMAQLDPARRRALQRLARRDDG
jgi:predicted transcriptional regulator